MKNEVDLTERMLNIKLSTDITEKISDPYGSMWIWGIKSPTWGVQVHAHLLRTMGNLNIAKESHANL